VYRPKQTNCQNEPAYSEHATVAFFIRYPDMTCHTVTSHCCIEGPHLIAECKEFG
jgi:hypothetical protein